MSEQAAAMAVLGVDVDAIGVAVCRWWGMDDAVVHMMRRVPVETAVRHPDSDDEQLRVAASCGNEALDALALPPARVAHALQQVAHRYGRVLSITLKDLQAALQPAAVSTAAAAGASA